MQMMLFNYMCFEEMTAPPIFFRSLGQSSPRDSDHAEFVFPSLTECLLFMFSRYSTTLVISSQIARESFRRRISVRTESLAIAVTVTNCYR